MMLKEIDFEQMKVVLSEMADSFSSLLGAGVMTKEGLSVATHFPASVDEEFVATMSAALVSISHNTAQKLFTSPVKMASLNTAGGCLLAMPCGNTFVMTLMVDSDTHCSQINQMIEHAETRLGLAFA
jgi:predicted regulator of Ras-like GTPase activity (Roadblock/LC7/MglB family)